MNAKENVLLKMAIFYDFIKPRILDNYNYSLYNQELIFLKQREYRYILRTSPGAPINLNTALSNYEDRMCQLIFTDSRIGTIILRYSTRYYNASA